MNDATIISVVDDDPSVLRSLERLIKSVGLDVETFPSPESFLHRPPSEDLSCLVLDLQMPGLTGLDLQRELRKSGLQIPIVFITGYGTIPQTVQAMQGGAVDFIEKPFADEQLLLAIHRAIDLHRDARRRRAEIDAIRQRMALLTPRERQVLPLVVKGMLNKQIAWELGITEKTVKVHRAQVMQKMRAGSVAELVRMMGSAGIDQGLAALH
jgi:RNA polymerase sigma factor (sigma-70 family)